MSSAHVQQNLESNARWNSGSLGHDGNTIFQNAGLNSGLFRPQLLGVVVLNDTRLQPMEGMDRTWQSGTEGKKDRQGSKRF